MKKRVFGRKLSREKDTRLALFRSLARSLILYGRIKTTKAKAKAVQPFVEKLVAKALKDKRKVYKVSSLLGNERKILEILYKKIAPSFEGVKGGFTRIIPLAERRGDAAEVVILEWSKRADEVKTTKKSKGGKGIKG